MPDPLDRDIFKRPESPDFWKLSEVLLWMDGRVTDKDSLLATIAEFIDPDTAEYVAVQRALRTGAPEGLWPVFGSLWLDGFTAGARFRGEHGTAAERNA